MNYQLMFQTIAMICGITSAIMAVWVMANSNHSKRSEEQLFVLFIITLITGALAAGLS